MNRQRNWIYSTQSPESFQVSAERALGVRSTESDAGSGADWMTDFFHDRSSPQRSQPGDPLSLQIPGLQDHVLGTASGLGISRQNDPLAPLQHFGVGGANLGIGSPATARPAAAPEALMSPNALSVVPNSVRELLVIPGSVNPLAAGFDPINLRVDGTRQELNPTLPDPLADLNPTPRISDSLLGQPERSVSEGPPSFLDSFNARMLGNSSLAPAVGPTPESRPAERPSGFGQFPTRRF
jgi:hypothetical protein